MDKQELNINISINDITCPITQQIFYRPVLANDGFNYEEWALKRLFDSNNPVSPLTREALSYYSLNKQLTNIINSLLNKNKELMNQQFNNDNYYDYSENKKYCMQLIHDKKWQELVKYKKIKLTDLLSSYSIICKIISSNPGINIIMKILDNSVDMFDEEDNDNNVLYNILTRCSTNHVRDILDKYNFSTKNFYITIIVNNILLKPYHNNHNLVIGHLYINNFITLDRLNITNNNKSFFKILSKNHHKKFQMICYKISKNNIRLFNYKNLIVMVKYFTGKFLTDYFRLIKHWISNYDKNLFAELFQLDRLNCKNIINELIANIKLNKNLNVEQKISITQLLINLLVTDIDIFKLAIDHNTNLLLNQKNELVKEHNISR